MSTTAQSKRLTVLNKRRAAGVHTALRQDRDDAVSIDVAVPGERREVDVLSDGSIGVEVFQSAGEIGDDNSWTNLLKNKPA